MCPCNNGSLRGSELTRPLTVITDCCMPRLDAALLLLAAVDTGHRAGEGGRVAGGGQPNTGPVQDLSAPSRTPK